jgi:gamma-glutamyltranspeptidase/glutathione hydrolase
MISAPHHLAAEAGAQVLREGGNAVEAMVAAAACIAVVYPHMNAVGGDGFWLIAEPGKEPLGVEACGQAAGLATIGFYKDQGLTEIPSRGPLAALTVAGTVGGWAEALKAAAPWGRALPLARLLAPAVEHGRKGVGITAGQESLTREKLSQLADVPGFAKVFLAGGVVPQEGETQRQPTLAATLEQLSDAGLDDFYRGDLARSIAKDMERLGAPIRLADLEAYEARRVAPLSVALESGRLYNMPPPTQGVSSLMILALFERLRVRKAESFEHIHGLVEAAKQAFLLRNAHVTDPAEMSVAASDWLKPALLDELAGRIDPSRALPWPYEPKPGDTIWMGAADAEGRVVSFIQSVYWEFGSGLVLPESGLLWQNRGTAFSLDPAHHNCLKPGKRPFHTLNPALARLKDGRTLAYGNMGGEGQPQSQSAVYSRHVMFGQGLQEAVTAPRWLLGRTWGENSTTLKLESRFDPALVDKLKAAGHQVELLEPFTSTMGHAGAVSVSGDRRFLGASDPRSDGDAVAL